MMLGASQEASRGTLCPASPSVCVWCGVPVVSVLSVVLGCTEDTSTNISLSGAAPGSPKVGSRMVWVVGGWGGGWSSRSSPRTGSPAFCGADHRRGRGGSRGRGRPCDLQRQVPAVPLLWRGGAPASVHRQSGRRVIFVENPQVQFLEKVVDVSVVCDVRCLSRQCRKLWGFCSSRCKCSWPRMSTTPPHGGRAGPGAGGWERVALHGQVPDHPNPQVAGTQYFAMDVDEVPATGSRPDNLAGVRPQERVPVDQIVDTAPALPILDVPVPLMGEQLVDVLRFFDTLCPVAEQVIAVPKISLEDIPARRLCREPQLVEQLVEVPTVVSYSSLLQRTVEQHVDIPVPGGTWRLAGLQGSLPGQSSTAPSVEQIVHIPGGGLQGSRPGQGSPVSSSYSPAGKDDDADEPGIGFFALFPG